MKTKVKRMSKRTLAVFLGVVMLMSCLVVGQITTVNAAYATTIYLDVTTKWGEANAWFVAHMWNDSNDAKDYTFAYDSTSGYYKADLDKQYSHYIFKRMNPSCDNSGSWSSGEMWNRAPSSDGNMPDEKNLYTITEWNAGTWSTYTPDAADSVTLSGSPVDTTINAGTSITFTASATNPVSDAKYKFLVDDVEVQNTTANTYTHTFNTGGTYKVKVVVNKTDYSDVESDEIEYTVNSTTTLGNSIAINATKVGGGSGTVKIDSGTAGATASKTVVDGTDVTFTATAESGSTFIGWYDSATCTNRVSDNATYTVNNVQSATSLYAAFVYDNYYLAGKFYLADRVQEKIIDYSNTTYHFTQSSSNPALYTYTGDFAFKWNDTEHSYKLQSVTVSNGTGTAYQTSTAHASSGTAASSESTNTDCNKWRCGDTTTGENDLYNCYKKVTFTWNAVTNTLSWTTTDVSLSDYTVLYIHNGTNNRTHLWVENGDSDVPLTTYPGLEIIKTPYIEDNSVTYNVILISNSVITPTDEVGVKLVTVNGNGDVKSEERDITGIEKGSSYKISSGDTSATEWSPISYTVTVNTTDNGHGSAATSSQASASMNTEITITTAQNEGYTALVTVTDASSNSVLYTKTSNTTFTFTMPESNVTVNVEYVEKVVKEISLRTNDSSLGTLSAAKSPYYPGDEVTITLTPASKATYVENSLKVTKSDDPSTTYTTSGSGNTYKFIMPNYDVVVSASFEEHVADADFWYDGYQRLAASGVNAGKLTLQTAGNLRFTEAMYNGNEYAYVKVTRADTDPNADHLQEFVVKTSLDAEFTAGSSSSGNCGTFYFLRPNWNTWNERAPRATFYSDVSGTTKISGPTNLGHVEDRSGDKKLYKINVPIGTKSILLDNGYPDGSLKSGLINGALLTGGGVQCTNDTPTFGAFSSGKSDQGVDTSITTGGESSGESTGSVWKYSTSSTTDAQSKSYKYIDDDAKYSAMDLQEFSCSSPSGEFAAHSQIVDPKSYYVVILYPNKDYGILYDGQTTVGSDATNYRVYATNRLPGEDDPTVNYWAKDGVVRMWSKTTAFFGKTTVAKTDYVTAGTSHNFDVDSNAPGGSGGSVWQKSEKWLEGTATKGQSITVSTQLTDDVKDKYYIKGFSFNGVTPEIYSWKADGLYSCTYTIPEDFKGNKLEITPIYFLKDDTNTITFYIDGFNETVQTAWGNELYVYPFYQYYKNGESGEKTPLEGQAENFRGYPGQPVVNYGGRRFSQIPLTDNGGAIGASDSYRVKGVTINNGYWDQVHGNTYGTSSTPGKDSNDNNIGADFVSVHRQTYDYDDFYKIYNENGKNGEKNLNSIYFTFKYKTGHQHRGTYNSDGSGTRTDQNADNADTLTSSNVSNHDWELLKNNFKKPVDLFGTKLSDAAVTEYNDKEIYVISEGYEANNAGKFATEWAIYKRDGNSFTKITESGAGGKTSIVPSVLAIASADRITAEEYPALDGDLRTTDYKGIYEALEKYKGVPVKICYEGELHGGTKSDGYDPAYRSDGRWTFTRTTDYIKGNVKIEYINEKLGVTSYTEDAFTEGTHIGSVTGASAYFTYNESESGYTAAGEGKTALSNLPIQDHKYFNFKAETAGSYEFIGWYSVDTNGDYHPVNNDVLNKVTGHSAMSTDSTFVARFKYVANGSLTISHTLASGNAGRGTTYLGVYVNGALIADEATNTDSVKLDKSYIGSNKTSNTIRVVLRTVANGENSFNEFTAKKTNDEDAVSDATDALFSGENSTVDQTTTREIEFTVDELFTRATQKVLALSYYSALTKPTNKYKITYNFNDRAGNNKSYTVKGDFTDAELSSYVEGTGTSKSFKSGATAFFADKAPHESNFQKTLSWTLDSMNDVSGKTWTNPTPNVYLVTASVDSTQTESVNKTAIFDVPYETNGSKENYTAKVKDGKVKMLTDEAHETFDIDTKYGKWFENIDTTNFDKNYENNDESSKLIIAPETITKTVDATETTMYFSYWKVSTLAKNSKAGKYVTKCFYPRFNYVAYDNYYIEAVYDSDSTKAYRNLVAAENLMDASISFLEDSRNQWNTNNDAESDSASVARDMIYNDFALAFKYQGKKLTDYTGKGTNNVRLGMVIQKLGAIDTSEGEHIGTLESYEDKYKDSVDGTVAKLQFALTSDTSGTLKWGNGKWANVTDAETNNKYASYNHIIAANNENITDVPDFNTTLIDNKNRTEYYYSLDNSQGQTADLLAKNVYNNKNYVYRVFSYIMVKNDGTWLAKVSEKPAYFCMYDRATRKH